MNIVADENIPGVKETFASLGNVLTLPGRKICSSDLKNTDILLVRSVTIVDEKLLKNTPVKYVGSATIGEDHIDTNWLKKNGIAYANAPGSNAQSVAEYVMTAIVNYCLAFNRDVHTLTIGIVGAGHVGTCLKTMLNKLEINVLVNDPLKSLLEKEKGESKSEEYVEFEEVLQADILTFHTPLVHTGEHPTWHKINDDVLTRISNQNDVSGQYLFTSSKNSNTKSEKLIINTARGGIIDNTALLKHLTKNTGLTAVLDVWEHEPDLNTELMDKCFLATPHIAGYSQDGKRSGTEMIFSSASDYFNLQYEKPELVEEEAQLIRLQFERKSHEPSLLAVSRLLNEVYPIQEDDKLLRQINTQNILHRGKYFDNLRKHYRTRREFRNYSINIEACSPEDIKILKALGFQLH